MHVCLCTRRVLKIPIFAGKYTCTNLLCSGLCYLCNERGDTCPNMVHSNSFIEFVASLGSWSPLGASHLKNVSPRFTRVRSLVTVEILGRL